MSTLTVGLIADSFERRFAAHMSDREIVCPHCNRVQDHEAYLTHVTYWGEGPPKICECESCEQRFLVRESVTRTFKCTTLPATGDPE